MFTKITEQNSNYDNLQNLSLSEILSNINKEDATVPLAVQKSLPQIENLTAVVVDKLKNGGRLFYIGAGTSGRLGVLDASECPPTFGVDFNTVIGIIAGGDTAIRKAVENAEDDVNQGWLDLQEYNIIDKDFVVGIAASGTTPYVIGALEICKLNGVETGCITCNEGSPLALACDYPIECVVGPEFITGSSRMKAGTAQKLILNMITTATMIQLGKIVGNKMFDMQLTNEKLVKRAVKMIIDEVGCSEEEADILLKNYGSVRNAVNAFKDQKS